MRDLQQKTSMKMESLNDLTEGMLSEMYKKMICIRRFEEKVVELYADGYIKGFVHTCIGEEAVAVGAITPLREDDYIVITHRGHGDCIAKGMRLDLMFAELLGKKDGYCKGKGGSMHLSDMNSGVIEAVGIVGSSIPLACGAALAIKLRKSDKVSVCFFGDGASNTGGFHESLNMASCWKLPVVLVCENNSYAISTSTSMSTSVKNIADRAVAYNIPGVAVDGNDVVAVYRAVKTAIDRARRGEGPSLIECKTYRWRSHGEGETDAYRSKEEVEEWKRKDPIENLRRKLIGMNILSEEEDGHVKSDATRLIDEAVQFAKTSPFPNPTEAMNDIVS